MYKYELNDLCAGLLAGPVIENQYGEEVSPEKAPEAISKAVASLPPEQMFELMRQMKLCVQVCYLYIHAILRTHIKIRFERYNQKSEILLSLRLN